MWLSVAKDMWELPLKAPPGLSMGQSLIFWPICGAGSLGEGPFKGKPPSVDPTLVPTPVPVKVRVLGVRGGAVSSKVTLHVQS